MSTVSDQKSIEAKMRRDAKKLDLKLKKSRASGLWTIVANDGDHSFNYLEDIPQEEVQRYLSETSANNSGDIAVASTDMLSRPKERNDFENRDEDQSEKVVSLVVKSKALWIVLYVALAILAVGFEAVAPMTIGGFLAAFIIIGIIQDKGFSDYAKGWIIVHLIGVILAVQTSKFSIF